MLGSDIGPCVRPVSDLFQTCFRPVSDLFQTCFRPLQKDHLIFAKPRPESVAHALAPAKPHRSNLRRHVGATLMLLIADQRFRNSMLHKCLELRSQVRRIELPKLCLRGSEKESEKDMNAPCLGRGTHTLP